MNENKKIIEQITIDMAAAQTADEIMKHWDKDVEWFDITARHLKGYDAVHAEFDEQFGKLECCGADILTMNTIINDTIGIVTTTQDFWAIFKGTDTKEKMLTRQTDCYQLKDGEWKLTHQHISLCIADVMALGK